ncbi:CLUMA_CG019434, isoform A [Clunio marinus]|uniref:CLUMA_CG019434, isoform A n=1 Tax=Clunio marinus TaxID=568069 RepID=A0A1J1J7L4_9DIPT|nr:CLUMA_CG019434, isoform A [Clunio marinus]
MLKHTLPLGSYLLKPVQRILKYHLLLDSLKKHCDLPEVKEAHEMMKDVARNIDQVKKKLEQKNRVKELSGILDGWLGPDLTVLGELRQEGLLMENNKPRIIFLFETMLIITKPKEDKRLQFKTYIPCKTLMLVEHLPGDPTSFHVLPFSDPRSQIKLTAKNRDQKRLWAQHIKQAMLEHFDIPNRAKELVFKLGDEEERPSDKHTWKWPHTSSTPEYLERRHQYRRSEVRYRSKKAKKNAANKSSSLERGRIKERRESFISYSREDLCEKDNSKKCDHKDNCECEKIKKELSETLKSSRSKSETRNPEKDSLEVPRRNSEDVPPLSPLEIKMYTSKTLPKRIEKIKQKRAKRETARFYTDLSDEIADTDDTILKIIEATDGHDKQSDNVFVESESHENDNAMNFSKKKDSEIIRSILEKSEFKKVSKSGVLRRKSLEQIERSPLSNRKLSEALAAIQLESSQGQSKSAEVQPIEPLYEELLRNVHVPYKFAPPIVKRSLSMSSSSSTKETVDLSPTHAASSTTINDDDGSDCDYVTLTYSNEGLETIDGDYVGKHSPKMLNDNISSSDFNISYNKQSSIHQLSSSDELKAEQSLNDSINDLQKHESLMSRSRSFLHKFITMKPHDDDLTSQKSVAASISSQKSFDFPLGFISKNVPKVYRQGSEDLGNRIAHVDYADPKTLFPSPVNTFINKNSLHQRDSVVSSSTDSVYDKHQKLMQQDSEPFSDSFYEDTAESVLENDFRDSAIYSDDSNGIKLESTLSEEHIYATVNKPAEKLVPPPKIAKKPSILLKPSLVNRFPPTVHSPPPPVPAKPSNLKTPEIRNAIFNVRKVNKNAEHLGDKSLSPTSSKSWVNQQVQKFQ